MRKLNKAKWAKTCKTAFFAFLGTLAFGTLGDCALRGDEETTPNARKLVLEVQDDKKLQKPTAYKAFLVAADNYGDEARSLSCTKNDALTLQDLLENLGFETIVLVTGAEPAKAPTKTIIERRYAEFIESLRPGDFAIVYLSGHGLQSNDSNEAFFVPVDFYKKDVFGSSVSIDKMLDALDKSAATFRWMIADCCRERLEESELLSSKSLAARPLEKIANAPEMVSLWRSCKPGQLSYEGAENANGVRFGMFTLSLLEALDVKNPKADFDHNGKLTFMEVARYVSKRTNELAHRYCATSQEPVLEGALTDFTLFDGLLIDGLTKADWEAANALYLEASDLCAQKRWHEALEKIREALKIAPTRPEYKTTEAEIAELVKEATLPKEYLNDVGIRFLLVEPGSFMMGNALTPEEIHAKYPGGKLEEYQNAPRHKVTLTKPYYMAKCETTVADFQRFVDATGYETTAEIEGTARGLDKETKELSDVAGLNWRAPGFKQESNHPVVCVSWEDAQAYVDWLNANAKFAPELGFKPIYRLPTEAQWEGAARSGAETEFFWGSNEPSDGKGYLNAKDAKTWSSYIPFWGASYEATAPTGNFKPNGGGFLDMAGNVAEWTSDWYGEVDAEAAIDPTGPKSGKRRVLRGGGWIDSAKYCRSAFRTSAEPTSRGSNVGFRVILTR